MDNQESLGELSDYLCGSFGNATRIDYGTGHETSFVIFLFCLSRLDLFSQDDMAALVLRVFVRYIALMRRLQTVYMLEPAGSHGVWSLDDYHMLPFYWGASQLQGNDMVTPDDSVSDDRRVTDLAGDYMYLGCVKFIKEVKAGVPFGESSPMLNDMSAVPSWSKMTSGMLKMYEGEVLDKFPVVQHLRFGKLFPMSWEPTKPAPGEVPVPARPSHMMMRTSSLQLAPAGSGPGMPVVPVTGMAPWAKAPAAAGEPTAAPWAKAPAAGEEEGKHK